MLLHVRFGLAYAVSTRLLFRFCPRGAADTSSPSPTDTPPVFSCPCIITMLTAISADVLFVLFDHLPLASLIRLRCTCHHIDTLFSKYFGGRFRTRLRMYFREDQQFLQHMTTTSSIVIGSTVLSILTRAKWDPADLDICTPHAYFSHMVSYLISVEQYTAVLELPHPHPLGAARFGCTSAVRLTRGTLVIDVLQSSGESALEGLRSAWNTSLLCYATPTSFTMAYPSTAQRHRSVLRPIHLLAQRYPVGSLLRHIETYRHRGCDIRLTADSWDREVDLDAECAGIGSETCALTVRFLGDRYSVTGGWWDVTAVQFRPPPRPSPFELTLAWWEGGIHYGRQCHGHGDFTTPSTTMILKAALGRDIS